VKALILVGGLGTRLRPLTYSRPKHLLPIANRPHIEHVFDLLARHRVVDVVLLTSYLAETFGEIIERASGRGMSIELTHESEPLGTAGALKHAESLVGDETFLAINGDVLTDVDIGVVIDRHREKRAEVTILLTPVDDPSAFGVVPTDEEGRVLGFIEKPPRDEAPTNLINAGLYVLEPSVLERVPPGEVWSAERQLFPSLVAEGARVHALAPPSYWMDIGTPEKYLQANIDALSGRYRTPLVAKPGPTASLLDDGAKVADGARVSSACLGAAAVVEEGASVERSVLLPEAFVGEGAVVLDSVIGEGARIEAGARVSADAVADGRVVTA
jgi:mannose-1-phosphate guanylyltransferase